ncbi:DNA-(apurinic or apyrimidinic site) lyase [Phytophthora pseudosyringae]|uniref:DNA-(apurinic or apyrimidinic site) endonuclease n=1 Tax=Phytophthora pseudosyringae TaxID=221518 RepID=A0A8T1VBM7_9STRA|nr:DNA-(apurinic or apyrimidinic site) lyase [Phytophthora pseudosyringae]
MVRQSARLKVAAEKTVAAVSCASSPAKKKRKSVVSAARVSAEVSTSEAPPAATKKAKKTDSTSAWGALFSGATSTKQERPRPMAAAPISPELQVKMDAFPPFEDVSRRSADNIATKIVAWNVNGLRAVLKRDESVHLRAYVAQEDPDIFCLSETKICREELQKLENFLPQYEHQFWSCAVKKGYASTAIFSKTKPLSVKDEIVVGDHDAKGVGKAASGGKDQEGRFLALEFPGFWLVHTYVPNAGGKLERLDFRTSQWDKAMLREMKEMEKSKPVIWCGDLNVAHQEIDIHNPKGNRRSAGFTDEERGSFGQILNDGFVDTFRHLHPDKVEYSYFGYRHNMRAKNKGWRLDYFVVSEALMPNVRSSFIRQSVVGSDHLPIGLELGGLS